MPKHINKLITHYISIEKVLIFTLLIIFICFHFLPYILFGKNTIITIHDNLDNAIPWYKMFKDSNLFFKFDVPTKGFSELSTLYYSVNFSIVPLIYMIFSDYIAYTINIYLNIIFGFFSMYFLIDKIYKKNKILNIFISFSYAILPVCTVLGIAINSIPLIVLIFIYFINKFHFSWKIFLIIFYPFISSFTMTGIFICCFWLLGFIYITIRNKKINLNLLVGFIFLCIGYILVDIRLFYIVFISKTQLNRQIFSISSDFRVFFKSIISYGINGFYHAASLQRLIIIPLAFIISLCYLFFIIYKILKQQGNFKIKKALINIDHQIKYLFFLEIIVFIFILITSLYNAGVLNNFINKYFSLLVGFNWGRIWIFNRVLWYIIFALCLQFLLEIDYIFLFKKIKLPRFIPCLCVYALLFLQLGYITLKPTYYNDAVKTWFNELIIKTGLANKIMPDKSFDDYISYKEFFAERLFTKIKTDISYSNEMVVALGYHPSVLMYNGFNCIDGYNNAYPLSYMQKFKSLIAPELKVNQWANDYYNSWGGRMYLYNSELDYTPTRNKNISPVILNIDMDVFRNDFNGKYILSRAEIANYELLGLTLVKCYFDTDSIYTIYLYT